MRKNGRWGGVGRLAAMVWLLVLSGLALQAQDFSKEEVRQMLAGKKFYYVDRRNAEAPTVGVIVFNDSVTRARYREVMRKHRRGVLKLRVVEKGFKIIRDNGTEQIVRIVSRNNRYIKTRAPRLSRLYHRRARAEQFAARKQPLLVIRVEFDDYRFEHSEAAWAQKFFKAGEGGLNDYYWEVSDHTFRFVPAKESGGTADDGIVTVRFAYDHPDPGSAYFEDTDEALLRVDRYVNFARYDKDGDGYISGKELQIMFLFAGGESATGARPGVWAHRWCLYGGNDEPPQVDGVYVMSCRDGGGYSRFGEKHFDADTGNDATIGVIAHELGHAVFDLPDLYDTDGSSEGIGNFGLMGGGAWGYRPGEDVGATPVHMTAWSKIFSGFVVPKTVRKSRSGLRLPATDMDTFRPVKLETGRAGEYFLLENRANRGYDRGLYVLSSDSGGGNYEGGLLITHIDDNLLSDCLQYNDCNDDEDHKLVDVEEANNAGLDGSYDRGRFANLFYRGNQDDFTAETDPNSRRYGGRESGVSVTEISDRADVMRADITIE